ncbi:MAG: glycoside hydrolase family 65 protein [Fibrobacterota bacterium]
MDTSPFCAHEDKGWCIAASSPENYTPLCLANGELGFLLSPDPLRITTTLCNGVYDRDGERSVARIMETIGFAGLEFCFDDRAVDPIHITDWRQVLDMKEASLTTFFTISETARFTCTFFALRQLPHCGLLQVSILPLRETVVTVKNRMQVPDTIRNETFSFETLEDGEYRIPLQQVTGKSKSGKYEVVTTAIYLFEGKKPALQGCGDSERDEFFKAGLRTDHAFTFALGGAICTSADFADPKHESERFCISMMFQGAETLIAGHRRAWESLWRHDIVIEGDPESQRNVRFALFNLFSSIRHDSRLSIPPMGLTSQQYNGHIFWDAELWMFPVLLALDPSLARNMLDYRFDHLAAARRRAHNFGYAGAMFPWESDDSGEEVTPTWALTGTFEHHVTADIGIACWQYWRVTRDRSWLQGTGWPLLKAIAEFWVSRVTENNDGTFSIHCVIGPDEYTGPVDDNAFTNAAAATALRYAVLAAKELKEKSDPHWTQIADKLVIHRNPEGATLQYRGYPAQGETIKQADANLLAFPLQYYNDEEQIRRDLLLYESRISATGPAMSHCVLSVIHARLGDAKNAWRLFEKCHKPNLLPPFGVFSESPKNRKTYFVTGAGGMLQAILYGFAGLAVTEEGLVRRPPCLPKHWNRLILKGVGPEGSDVDSAVEKALPVPGKAKKK